MPPGEQFNHLGAGAVIGAVVDDQAGRVSARLDGILRDLGAVSSRALFDHWLSRRGACAAGSSGAPVVRRFARSPNSAPSCELPSWLAFAGRVYQKLFSFLDLFIDRIFISFPNGDYQNIDFLVNDFIDEAVTTCSELDFIMVSKA